MNRIFEILFNQMDTLRIVTNPGWKPPSHHMDELSKLPPHLLRHVLEGYSAAALQDMARARGLDPLRKRANLEQDLSNHFYDISAISQAINGLSTAAREGFYYIQQAGGIISLGSWRMKLAGRYGKPATDQAQAELIGGLLALYGNNNSYGMSYSFPYKNELAGSTVGSPQIYLWTHAKALSLFKVNPTEEAQYLGRIQPQIYSGPAPTPPTTPGFDSLLADLVSMTRYFEQNQVRALVSGEPGKRDFIKLNDALSVKEPGEIKKAKKMEELGRLFFLWSLLKETQLVGRKVDADIFQANPAGSEEFFSLPRYRQARLLAGAWVRCEFNEFQRIPSLIFHRMTYYESSLPDARKTSQARLFLLGLLDYYRRQASLRSGEWLDFSGLVRVVQELDPNFLISHDFSESRPGFGAGYDYDLAFPVPGFYGEDYYAGFTSTLKLMPKGKGGYRMPGEVGAALKLSEDFALVEGEWLAQVFAEPLAWLGLAELARDEKGRPLAVRLTDLGIAALADQPSERERQQEANFRQLAAQGRGPELTRGLLVQPNFDVMVIAPLENLSLLRQVDRFAGQTSMGDVALYHISKDSVLRGLRSGLRGPDIIQTLRENNRVPVASNVVQTIEDWATEFERLILYENCNLVETPDEATLDRLLAQPGSEKFIVKRIGPTFALITGAVARPPTSSKPGKHPAKPPARSKPKELLPVYLDYQDFQPGSLSLEGDNLLKIKPEAGNPYLFYRVGQFAELVEWSKNPLRATFRLSRQAGQRAQQNGLTFNSVAQFLAEVLPRPTRRNSPPLDQIPPETLLALKGWLGYYGPVQVEKALTIQAGQAAQLFEIFNLDEFKPALLGWAGPNIALVRESHFPQLTARLKALGMPVSAPGEPASPGPPERPKKGKRSGPEETAAERERKIRELEETRPNLLPGKAAGSRNGSLPKEPELSTILDLLDLMAGTGVAPAELEQMLDNLEGDRFNFPVRSHRKRDY